MSRYCESMVGISVSVTFTMRLVPTSQIMYAIPFCVDSLPRCVKHASTGGTWHFHEFGLPIASCAPADNDAATATKAPITTATFRIIVVFVPVGLDRMTSVTADG